jgi:hypothetical protein
MVIRKSLDLPPEVGRSFVKAMNDYFAEDNPSKQDAIAAHQLSVLNHYRGRRDDALRLCDVKELFRRMRVED